MIPLSHPILRDYLAAFRRQPLDSWETRVYLFERLMDEGGVGYVGDKDGPTLADACLWYARCDDQDEPALRMALAEMDEMLHPEHPMMLISNVPLTALPGGAISAPVESKTQLRVELVRAMKEDVQLFVQAVSGYFPLQNAIAARAAAAYAGMMLGNELVSAELPRDHPAAQAASNRAKAAVCRDLRRRVLALYPEVEVTLRCALSNFEYPEPPPATKIVREFFANNGFRLDLDKRHEQFYHRIHRTEDRERRLWVYTQTLTAPDLIPPEPPDFRAGDLVGVDQDGQLCLLSDH